MTYEDLITRMTCEFELAFLSTGLKPVSGDFGDGINNGCMITALDVSEHGNAAMSPPEKGIVAALKYGVELICRDAQRVQRVIKVLAAEHVQFHEKWWGVFVNYCILSFDGNVTFPRQWIKRNRYQLIRGSESPKLMGAAVGGLVQRHVLAAARTEICKGKNTRTHHSFQPVQGGESQEPAWWPSGNGYNVVPQTSHNIEGVQPTLVNFS
jgi:hypothetical protein